MSRCFPFPPPGYERKPTIDEPDLLKKEKRKEKKHKKDKKDKEKKDSKEKSEKDRSKGKHKEKKDKDKKKDKEKTKISIPDKKNIYGQFEGYNGELLHHNNEQDKEKNGFTGDKKQLTQFPHQNGDLLRNRNKVGDTENSKFVQELDRRIRDEEKGMGSHQFAVEGIKNNVNQVEIQKTDRRQVVMDVTGFGGNVMVSRMNGSTPPLDNRRHEKMKEKGSDGRQVVMDVAGFGGNVAVPNRINGITPPPLDNRRFDKMQEKGSDDKRKNKDRDKQKEGKDKEMEYEKKMEKVKEKDERKKAKMDKNRHMMKSDSVDIAYNLSAYPLENSIQGVGNEGLLKKRKAIETNGVSHENEPRPNKMARSVSNISPENGRKLDFLQNPSPSLLDKQGASQGTSLNSHNVGSKGGQRVNGVTTSQPVSISAKKPPMPAFNHVPSKSYPIKSPSVITNQVATQSPPTIKPQLNHIAVQPPTSKPSSTIPNTIPAHHQLPSLSPPPPPVQPPSTSSKQPMSQPKPPPAVVNKVAPPPPPPLAIPKKKPPHPDTKHLTQILSVPKLDPWCGFDAQEWLLSSKAAPTSKKPPINEPEDQVWSEAKHIESVDVCALPYVIPY
ncbi:hypothetical protein E3N88_15056 [Mikania micrantha]|uniref:Uncharacterized protein n=1 Tax=Mikania micrantha TaxID=192012 RepID=A0A5N6LCS9_9ASTR|nr:hypothetical protein E3N88_44172 [Mikania micrantha]KAD5803696.1 hypothetical protein E3N88_15056 [Mikania micrantha]